MNQELFEKDQRLSGMLPHIKLLNPSFDPYSIGTCPGIEHHIVQMPDEYRFLHETAVIEFHGTLFAAWYNNQKFELSGLTPIRERRSSDGGKTWGPVRIVGNGGADGFLNCPPVFGIDDDRLYLLMNRMTTADHIHSLDLYLLDEPSGEFRFLWSKPIPFKLNTNVCRLPNGKLFLAGRIADKLDDFPYYPACLISDPGKIDADWRPVSYQTVREAPDGELLGHAETSAIVLKNEIYAFSREDNHTVPLLYHSADLGETWSGPIAHDIPFAKSKIYAGTLSDGRNYVIGNLLDRDDPTENTWCRNLLAIFYSEPGTMKFTHGGIIHTGADEELKLFPQWSYPVAYESNEKLYVIYTMQTDPVQNVRGAILSVIPL